MPPQLISKNTLFYGDNLDIMREYLVSETIDLVYLDPPFNSNRNYNVLFADESGNKAQAQILAFEDTWHWSEEAYNALLKTAPSRLATVVTALVSALGRNQLTAYLVMMAARLIELHRLLKPTGSLYLHCDPTASHYLKIVLDTIFGSENYQNEISWKRTGAHSDGAQGRRGLGRVHDIIFFYTKSNSFTWNVKYTSHNENYINSHYSNVEPSTGRRYQLDNLTGPGGAAKGNPIYEVMGVSRYWRYSKEKMQKLIEEGRIIQPKPGAVPRYKRYLDEMQGDPLQDSWDDIPPINSQAKERLGYPTQKPIALLERIVELSSTPGDVVLDPFCGCGTAIAAAQQLGRRWIGIDITRLAVTLQKFRLKTTFSLLPQKDYAVIGEPTVLAEARDLATKDDGGRYQFQWWALGLIEARPLGGAEGSKQGKKGSDQGIDGEITFVDDNTGVQKRIVVQVKSGKVKSGDIRDLRGTLDREGAAMAVFITLEKPTDEMRLEADAAGFYTSPGWHKDYRRIQILTIEALLAKTAEVRMPPSTETTFKQAQKATAVRETQLGLLDAAEEE